MKQALLYLAALMLCLSSFAQVPANDLIENAIEIDPSNYVDENLRLDLATTTGFENSSCGTGTFAKVFYKFTATTDGDFSAELTDMISTPITQSFVILFTAPDLNQTDESQLALGSICEFNDTGTLTVTTGQSYYLQVHRIDANALSRITFSFVAPPPNDSIENAIEITTADYNDENLRLDLAATNLGGQISCDVNGFSTVYYKFTAEANGTASFFLFPQAGGTLTGNAFVIMYTAPNLNATSNSELTLISNCAFETQPSINIVDGQSYYVLVHRDAPGELSRVAATISQDGTPEERQALIDLYNATNGPNWPFNAGWNTTAPLSDWVNVTVENGHVVSVVLATFGVTGTLPSSLSDLTFLEIADFRSNNLFGEVPDLSTIPTLEIFDINQNNFSVGDIETHYTNNSTISDFRYASQHSVNPIINFEPVLGSNYTLNITPDTGSNVNYQWFKDRGFLIDNIPVSGATTAAYELTNIQSDDLDRYICEITSPLIPDLVVQRYPINLTGPVSQQEKDALIAFYNALDGDNWLDNTNWLSTEPVGSWKFIKTRGNKVIEINIFGDAGLNGVLPEEIGDLIHLEMLSIGIEINLFGELPSTIGNLTALQRLRLQLTSNTGVLPSSIGNLTNLRELRLIGNLFSGELPSTIGNLTELTDLYIPGTIFSGNGNNFSGPLPTSIGDLTNLWRLQINTNSFDGQLPSSMSNLINLLSLSLNENNFSGQIPDLSSFPTPETLVILIENNYFDFSDLEPLVNNGVTYGFLSYSPQRTLDVEQTIESPPGVDIILDLNDTNLNRNTEDTTMNNEYQWYKDNNPINGAISNTYTIVNAQESDSGIYFCEITNITIPDLVIVRADITVLVDNNLNLNDIPSNSFYMFPNPTSDVLHIKFPNAVNNIRATIHSVQGKILMTQVLNDEHEVIDISSLANGMYLLTINTDNTSMTKRIIKR